MTLVEKKMHELIAAVEAAREARARVEAYEQALAEARHRAAEATWRVTLTARELKEMSGRPA